MTHDVCVVRPDHTVEEAARMMAAIDVGLLPVGEQDRLVGMITDRDIAVRAVAEGKGPATQVEAGVREVGAYRGIAQPGGAHNTGEYMGE